MGQTPDRDPGIRQEEAIDFEDQALDPTIIGRLQRNGAALLFKKDGGAAVDLSLAEADNKDVKVSSDDTTPGFLEDKIVAGGDLLKAVLNPGANELLQLTANIGTIFSADSINATTVLSTTSAVPQNAFLGEPRDHLIPATDGDYLVFFSGDFKNSNNNAEMEIALAKNVVLSTEIGSEHIYASNQRGGSLSVWRFDGLVTTDKLYATFRHTAGPGSSFVYNRNLFMFRVA
jgi:hypothetical protein